MSLSASIVMVVVGSVEIVLPLLSCHSLNVNPKFLVAVRVASLPFLYDVRTGFTVIFPASAGETFVVRLYLA